MKNIRKVIIIISVSIAILLFSFGIYLLNSINSSKSGNLFSDLLNLNEYSKMEENINILLLATDDGVKEDDKIDTDVVMVINFNPNENKLNLLSIPNNTKTDYNGENIKISSIYNEAGMKNNGCIAVRDSIMEMLKIEINYYILIKSDVFCEVIDEVGGISYNITHDLKYEDKIQSIDIKKGEQQLDGKNAENFIKFLKPLDSLYNDKDEFKEVENIYNGSDFRRIEVQHDFIKKLIKQKSNLISTGKFQDIIGIIFNKLETDFNLETFIQIGTNLKNVDKDTIHSFNIELDNNETDFTGEIFDIDLAQSYSYDKIIKRYFSKFNEVTKKDKEESNKDVSDNEEEIKNSDDKLIDNNNETEDTNSELISESVTNSSKTENPTKTPVKTDETTNEQPSTNTSTPTKIPTEVPTTSTTEPVTTEPTSSPTVDPTSSDTSSSE
jgi:LCP family protein required for cell wall assembly